MRRATLLVIFTAAAMLGAMFPGFQALFTTMLAAAVLTGIGALCLLALGFTPVDLLSGVRDALRPYDDVA